MSENPYYSGKVGLGAAQKKWPQYQTPAESLYFSDNRKDPHTMKCKKIATCKERSEQVREWENAKTARKKLKTNPLKKTGTSITSVKSNNDAVGKKAK